MLTDSTPEPLCLPLPSPSEADIPAGSEDVFPYLTAGLQPWYTQFIQLYAYGPRYVHITERDSISDTCIIVARDCLPTSTQAQSSQSSLMPPNSSAPGTSVNTRIHSRRTRPRRWMKVILPNTSIHLRDIFPTSVFRRHPAAPMPLAIHWSPLSRPLRLRDHGVRPLRTKWVLNWPLSLLPSRLLAPPRQRLTRRAQQLLPINRAMRRCRWKSGLPRSQRSRDASNVPGAMCGARPVKQTGTGISRRTVGRRKATPQGDSAWACRSTRPSTMASRRTFPA